MSDDQTSRLQLPYLAAAQAQKHITLNEALGRLDALVACRALSRVLSAPPPSPADGDLYIAPAPGLSGAWSGAAADDLLVWVDGAWAIESAPVGLMAYVVDEGRLLLRGEGGWAEVGDALGAVQDLERLGLGATADAANPLSAKLNAALFTARSTGEGGSGDLRITFNKQAAADVLSLLFQTGYAARAEIGLVGDDRLRMRVSADGASFVDAVTVESDGRVGVGASAGSGVLTVGGSPPTSGALEVVGAAEGVVLALSDNLNASLYVRTEAGGAIIGTDPGGMIHFAVAGNAVGDRRVTVSATSVVNESALSLWIDTGSGLIARRVTAGAADSAGAGYRQLRIPN